MAQERVSPQQFDRERARIDQIEREARQEAIERAQRSERERLQAEAEALRDLARRRGEQPLFGLTRSGETRAVRVDPEGYVIFRLAPEDLSALRTVLRVTGEEARHDVRSRAQTLDKVRAIVEQILSRYEAGSP